MEHAAAHGIEATTVALRDWLVVLPVILCLAGAAVLVMLRQLPRWQFPLALAVLAAVALGEAALMARIVAEGPVAMTMGGWAPPFGISFAADMLGVLFALAAAVVAIAVLLFSRLEAEAAAPDYLPLLLMLLGGVSGAFLTGDLFNLYVWFEVMLIASFGLMAGAGTPLRIDAAFKYGILNLIGTTVFLAALGLLYGTLGTLSMADIVLTAPAGNRGLVAVIAAMLLLAFATKAAAFPVQAWLPASYHAPPSSVSALFGGLLTKVGAYALLRTLILVLPAGRELLEPVIAIVAILTLLLSPLAAFAETNLRRAVGFFRHRRHRRHHRRADAGRRRRRHRRCRLWGAGDAGDERAVPVVRPHRADDGGVGHHRHGRPLCGRAGAVDPVLRDGVHGCGHAAVPRLLAEAAAGRGGAAAVFSGRVVAGADRGGGAAAERPADADRRHPNLGACVLACRSGRCAVRNAQPGAGAAGAPATAFRAAARGGAGGGAGDRRLVARALAGRQPHGGGGPFGAAALPRSRGTGEFAMSYALAAILLAVLWAVVSGSVTLANLLFGALVGVVVLLLLRGRLHGTGLLHRLLAVLDLAVEFTRELLGGAAAVIRLSLHPHLDTHLKPRFVAFRLRVEGDFQIALLANLITLTPGTLSVEVSGDRRTLFVHVLDAPDREAALRSLAEGLEDRVMAVFA